MSQLYENLTLRHSRFLCSITVIVDLVRRARHAICGQARPGPAPRIATSILLQLQD